ncbi:MAG: hypothetical protein A3J83_05665 [Elusimicrobia bacterium RIFOXYA2_FULL_40_6]|nr:MAG: hypothetical protein A3J83_05665 [Elusimicrobia bacterium RIFOXYA2_FULL_40_6]
MKLRTKLIVFSGFLVALSLVIAALLLLFFEKQFLLKKARENQANVSENFSRVCKEAVINDDDILLVNYLDSLKKDKMVAYAAYLDDKNKIIAHTQPKLIGSFSGPDESRKNITEVSAPVIIGKKKPGIAKIGFSKTVIDEDINQSLRLMLNRIVLASFVVFLIGILVSIIFANVLNKTINLLVNGARAIGGGTLDQQIKINSKDELGELSKEFNDMALKLKELDQMKSDFVSSITHELRTPLAAITGYSELLLEEDISETVKKYSITIRDNGLRLGNFINNILDLAKIEAGELSISKQEGDIIKLILETIEFFKPLTMKKRVVLKLANNADSLFIRMDSDKIRQVMINLIGNALKFTPEEGEIILKIEPDEIGKQIKIGVRDTGVGIPVGQLEKIFDKFYQVRGVTAKGTGLGLSIVKGIIKAHGGRIWAESKEGKGSEFIFVLPV